MTHYDIVKKLIGEIQPVGESNTDERRLENLNETIKLVDSLIFDITKASQHEFRDEHSMRQIGKVAANYLDDLKDQIETNRS